MRTDRNRTHLRGLPWWLVMLMTASIASGQVTNTPRSDFWFPDGPVKAVVETNGVLYVGGVFDYVGPVLETGNAFDRVFGNALPGFPKFNGAIKAIASDNAGGWFVGGLFTSVDGYNITNLAHIRSDWTLNLGWLPNPNGSVLALAAGEGMLYVGGTFSRIGGRTNSCVAALDPTSGVALAWRADVSTLLIGTGPMVTALVLSDGLLYVGGFFSRINTNLLEHLGAVDALTGQPTSWIPNSYNASQSLSRIDALAISGHVLYVAGSFATIGGGIDSGPARRGLAALDTTKNLEAGVLPWNPSPDGPVTSIAVSCDIVYVAGSFSSVGAANRNGLAALEGLSVTGQATSWNPDANGEVLKVVHAGNIIYVGGKFTAIGGQRHLFAAALDTEKGLATSWDPAADFGVTGLAVSSGAVVAGGIAGPGGKQRKNLAAFDIRTAQLLDWNPVVSGSTPINNAPSTGVYAIAATTNAIYFGGPFTNVNTQTRNRLASVHPVTGALNLWNPNADFIVESLAVSPTAVFAGGLFTTLGGQRRTNIAALNLTDGAALPSWNPSADGKVSTLSLVNNTLYAGGGFISIGGVQHKYAVAVDTATGLPIAWNAGLDSFVFSLVATPNRIYLGGLFSRVGTGLVHRLTAVDLDAGDNTCWKPEVIDRFGSGSVTAIALSSNAIYAGGSFTNIGGQPRRYLAALDPNCPGNATPWQPLLDASVDTLAVARGSVVAGGAFQSVAGLYRPNLAVFPLQGSPVLTLQPSDQKNNAGQTVSLTATVIGNGDLSYQWQRNGTNVPGATAATLAIPNAQVSHSGIYTLVVTNALGLINSRPVNVLIVEPVRILTQPSSQSVSPGTTVTLSITAAGSPPPIYQWRLNGVDIPGAVQSTLTLTNVQPTNGGSYNVAVASAGAALSSATATLLVTTTAHPFADLLQDSVVLIGSSGLRSGNNVGATHEGLETNHVGKLGGASVWARWVAPSSGIATFSTRGSSFDTLLAIYTGTQMQNLVPVASDEDSGGFLTSQALFSVTASTEYLMAIDGFGSASGNLVLSWSLENTTTDYPRFLSQPKDASVRTGGTNLFSVTVHNIQPVTYQWFHECLAIPGATNSSLRVGPVQVADVGRYHVEVMNASNRTARSFDASLDIGPDVKVVSQDKLEDILGDNFGDQPGGFGPLVFVPASVGSGFLPVSAGTIDSQTMNNIGAGGQLGETNHCNVLGGASKWFGLNAVSSGTFIIDTIGSSIDTVLAVYRATNLIYLSTALIDCDNNSAPDGIRSMVKFNAVGGRNYTVVVDGVNKAEGNISLNWKFGIAPPPNPVPAQVTVPAGTNLTLCAISAGAVPAPDYRWLFNGIPINGATQSCVTISNVQAQLAGTYSVIVSNVIGVATQTIAVITVGRLGLVSHGLTNGYYSLSVTGIAGQRFVLQANTNLSITNWTSLLTTSLAAQPFLYLDTNTARNRQRVYRTQNTQ